MRVDQSSGSYDRGKGPDPSKKIPWVAASGVAAHLAQIVREPLDLRTLDMARGRSCGWAFQRGRVRLWMTPKMIPSVLVANSSETGTKTGCVADFVVSDYQENGYGWETWREGSDECGGLGLASTIDSV